MSKIQLAAERELFRWSWWLSIQENPRDVAKVVGALDVDDFTYEGHRILLPGLQELLEDGEPIDVFTVYEASVESGTTLGQDSEDILMDLFFREPTGWTAPDSRLGIKGIARFLRNQRHRRAARELTLLAQSKGEGDSEEVADLLERAAAESRRVRP